MTIKFKPGDKVKRKDGKQFSAESYLATVSEVGESHFGFEQVFIEGGGWVPPERLELVEDTSFFGLDKKEFTQDQLEELASLVACKVAEFKKEDEPKEVTLYGHKGKKTGNFQFQVNKDMGGGSTTCKITFTEKGGVVDWSTLKGENL